LGPLLARRRAFCETNGYERDARRRALGVPDNIKSLNDDKPYDRFVLEQLAGDELADAPEESLVATGFLRVGTYDDEPNDPLKYKFEQLDDLIHATSTSFLAITLGCARCHDHKFDPIPQRLRALTLSEVARARGRWPTPIRPRLAPVCLNAGDPRGEGGAPGFLSPVAAVKTIERRAERTSAAAQPRWITDPKNGHRAGDGESRLALALRRRPFADDNFGVMGTAPALQRSIGWPPTSSRPWRIKRLHKMILLSSTYRMDSSHAKGAEYANKDFANEHWYRTNRRRLEAEPLRDAMLFVSGRLNTKAGGPGFYPPASKQALEGLSKKGAEWGTSPPEEQRRRSIYMFTKRSLLLPLVTVFDSADTTQPCVQRNVSTVAASVALLNNNFVHQQSDALARRATEAGGDPAHATGLVAGPGARADLTPGAMEREVAGRTIRGKATCGPGNFPVNQRRRHPRTRLTWLWPQLCHVVEHE
jgi:hypothetical protein